MSFASVFGAAQCGRYRPGTRLVLVCIESNANSAGLWNATDAAIAREMRLSVDTVSRGVAALTAGMDLEVVRHKRRWTTYKLLRKRGEDATRPRHEPEIEARLAPPIPAELSPQNAEPTAELSPQNPETKSPIGKNPIGKEERAATASPPPPAPVSSPVSIASAEKEARRIEAEPVAPPEPRPAVRSGRKTSAPEDPPREIVELANGKRRGAHRIPADFAMTPAQIVACQIAGVDPWPLLERFRRHYGNLPTRLLDWGEKLDEWIATEPERRHWRGGGQPGKPDRTMQALAAFAAVRQAREARL